jgi:RNA polymerase sigma factor (sigma-70 family)
MTATIHGLVEGLEPELRDTLQLHYYQDLPLQETADALGIATSTVKYRLRQALAELQRQLSAEQTWLGLRPASRII